MTDEQLIMKWNRIKNKRYLNEDVTIEEIENFNRMVQESYNSGELSQPMKVKYSELMCYLGTNL